MLSPRKGFGWIVDREGERAETRRLADRAAELGREDAVALSAAGAAKVVVLGELATGIDLLERGLALDRNLAWGWHFKSLASAFNSRRSKRLR
jgi:hypothetical protein